MVGSSHLKADKLLPRCFLDPRPYTLNPKAYSILIYAH